MRPKYRYSKITEEESHDPTNAVYNGQKTPRTAVQISQADKQHKKQTGLKALGNLTKNLAKKNIWTKSNYKDIKTGFWTELKRIAANKQRINTECDQLI